MLVTWKDLTIARCCCGRSVLISDPGLVREILDRTEDFDKPAAFYRPVNQVQELSGQNAEQ
jgi:hypothetical protein